MSKIYRRHFLKKTLGAAAIPSLALIPQLSYAANGRVIVGTWGGDYQVLLQDSISPLLRRNGTEVIYDVSSATQRITKVEAERNSRRSSVDVALLGETDMFRVSVSGALAPIDEKLVPNLANVYEQFKTPYSIPHIFSAMTIVYNKERIPSPPDSLMIFTDPAYRGKIGFSDILFAYNALFLGGISGAKQAGDYAAAIEYLKEVRKNAPRVYPSNEAVAAAFKSEEIWVSCMWKARALQWSDAGLPLDYVIPKEGGIPVSFEASVTKNSRNSDNAWRYLNAMLEPEVQLASARVMGYAPTIKNIDLPPDLQARVGFTDEELARLRPYDMKAAMEGKAEFLNFWNQEFKTGL